MDTIRFLMFYRSFDAILKNIKKMEMSYMKEYGLRSVHMDCLLRIKQSKDGMTATELAKASKKDKALISRVIRELTSQGFISVNGRNDDKSYNKRYVLTEKSEGIVSDIVADISQYMAKARVGIPGDDMQKFYEVLASLTHNISLITIDE
jgi:DNA-binding MarR family transcriptional regulator